MQKPIVHIAAFVAMLFWGMSYIWSKVVFEYYTPLTSIFLRLIISFTVLFLFIHISGQREAIRKKDIRIFIISALFNPFLYFVGEYYGLHRVSASVSAIIIATIPVFTPVVAFYVFREKLSVVNIAGLTISFSGILFLIFKKDFTLNASPVGVALLFLAVFAAIIYSVYLKRLSGRYKPATIIAWQNLIGTAYFLPFFLVLDAKNFVAVRPDPMAIASLVMLGVFASSMCYMLYTYSVKHLGISRTNIYTNLIPVFAGVTSYLALDEAFNLYKIGGMLIVLFGVILSQMNLKKLKSS